MGSVPFGCTDGDADTELCLRIGGDSCPRSCSTSPSSSSSSSSTRQYRQPLTIFHAGRICICNVTAVQAGAIVSAAEREVNDGVVTNTPHGSGFSPSSGSSPVSSDKEGVAAVETGARGKGCHRLNLLTLSPTTRQAQLTAPQTQQLLLYAGPPTRRSLQRFLQMRQTRTSLGTSPYARPRNHLPLPADRQRYLHRGRGEQQPPHLSLS